MKDRFYVDGGCWCAPERTLQQLRIMGHDDACTQARQGWAANMRHLSALARQRAEDEAAGRLMREAAEAALNA